MAGPYLTNVLLQELAAGRRIQYKLQDNPGETARKWPASPGVPDDAIFPPTSVNDGVDVRGSLVALAGITLRRDTRWRSMEIQVASGGDITTWDIGIQPDTGSGPVNATYTSAAPDTTEVIRDGLLANMLAVWAGFAVATPDPSDTSKILVRGLDFAHWTIQGAGTSGAGGTGTMDIIADAFSGAFSAWALLDTDGVVGVQEQDKPLDGDGNAMWLAIPGTHPNSVDTSIWTVGLRQDSSAPDNPAPGGGGIGVIGAGAVHLLHVAGLARICVTPQVIHGGAGVFQDGSVTGNTTLAYSTPRVFIGKAVRESREET